MKKFFRKTKPVINMTGIAMLILGLVFGKLILIGLPIVSWYLVLTLPELMQKK